jgi:hypothetical protein
MNLLSGLKNSPAGMSKRVDITVFGLVGLLLMSLLGGPTRCRAEEGRPAIDIADRRQLFVDQHPTRQSRNQKGCGKNGVHPSEWGLLQPRSRGERHENAFALRRQVYQLHLRRALLF